jgi:hypothetical protein
MSDRRAVGADIGGAAVTFEFAGAAALLVAAAGAAAFGGDGGGAAVVVTTGGVAGVYGAMRRPG